MTAREAAIVMAYTDTLIGSWGEYYKYLRELFGRSIYTHEIPGLADEIKARSMNDFVSLCTEDIPELACCANCGECDYYDGDNLCPHVKCHTVRTNQYCQRWVAPKDPWRYEIKGQ